MNLGGVEHAKVEIEAAWQDHVDLDFIEAGNFDVKEDVISQSLTVDVFEGGVTGQHGKPILLKVRVPELFNSFIAAKKVDLTMKNKVTV